MTRVSADIFSVQVGLIFLYTFLTNDFSEMNKGNEDILDKGGPSSSTEGHLDLNEEDQKKLDDILADASSAPSDDVDEWNSDPAPSWIPCGCPVVHVQDHEKKCKKQKTRIQKRLQDKVRQNAFCAKIRKLEMILNQVESAPPNKATP